MFVVANSTFLMLDERFHNFTMNKSRLAVVEISLWSRNAVWLGCGVQLQPVMINTALQIRNLRET